MNDFYETMLCNKVARIFESCTDNVVLFIKEWLNSSTNEQIIKKQPAIISQGYLYIKEMFYDEVGTLPNTKENLKSDNLFWLGYILTYIQFNYDISGKDIWENYDILSVLSSADVLHTLSNNVAAETIINDFSKSNRAKLNIFGDF